MPGAVEWYRRGGRHAPRPEEAEAALPSLRRQITIERLRPWAEEFDALDDQRYRAQDFVRWLELELAPPAKPKEDCGPVYSLVGEGALAMVG